MTKKYKINCFRRKYLEPPEIEAVGIFPLILKKKEGYLL